MRLINMFVETMRNQRSNQATTLIEILVATSIASMVLMGALLSTTAVQKSVNDQGANYANKSGSSAVLDHILRNASLAMGSDMGPEFDKGILIGRAETGDPDTFCIHQNVDGNGVTLDTAQDTTNDHWLCYTLSGGGVYYCYKPYSLDPTIKCGGQQTNGAYTSYNCDYRGVCCRGAQYCPSGVTGTTFLGTASSWAPTFVSTGRKLSFNISINSQMGSSAAQRGGPPSTAGNSVTGTTVNGGVTPAMHSIGSYVPCRSDGHACDTKICGTATDNCSIRVDCLDHCTDASKNQRCVMTDTDQYKCVTDGGWSPWSPLACPTYSCGTNVIRTRQCNNPAPANGGNPCIGTTGDSLMTESQSCNIPLCQVYSPWSACSVTLCGSSGTQTRTCTISGAPCDPAQLSKDCTTPACSYSSWGSCSATLCGTSGTQTRTCTTVGASCDPAQLLKDCTTPACSYSGWVGACGVCGSSTQTRICTTVGATCPADQLSRMCTDYTNCSSWSACTNKPCDVTSPGTGEECGPGYDYAATCNGPNPCDPKTKPSCTSIACTQSCSSGGDTCYSGGCCTPNCGAAVGCGNSNGCGGTCGPSVYGCAYSTCSACAGKCGSSKDICLGGAYTAVNPTTTLWKWKCGTLVCSVGLDGKCGTATTKAFTCLPASGVTGQAMDSTQKIFTWQCLGIKGANGTGATLSCPSSSDMSVCTKTACTAPAKKAKGGTTKAWTCTYNGTSVSCP
ncbi:MAG: hypothetical protein HQL15_07925 [Candidatus Omnitrophica bacterium]|nr:hypothetical protein [Candidatus Omnitrophota bacterium]